MFPGMNYSDKQGFLNELALRAELFIDEFIELNSAQLDLQLPKLDKTPRQMLAYQLGWLDLVKSWDDTEVSGTRPQMPQQGIKWNQLGILQQTFYTQYQYHELNQLIDLFKQKIILWQAWTQQFTEQQLFSQGYRQWTGTNPNWPLVRWLHINSIAPFKTFRSKIRNFKKQLKTSY